MGNRAIEAVSQVPKSEFLIEPIKPKRPSLLWILVPIFGWLKWFNYLLELKNYNDLKGRASKLPQNGSVAPTLMNNPPRTVKTNGAIFSQQDNQQRISFRVLEIEPKFKEVLTYLEKGDTHRLSEKYKGDLINKIDLWREWASENPSSLTNDFKETLCQVEKALFQRF